jgi:hypothetical protein
MFRLSAPWVACAAALLVAAARAPAASDDLKPRWKVGDRWVVETETRPVHATDAPRGARKPLVARWEFKVAGVEKVGGHDCYRVDIRHEGVAEEPFVTLWADRDSLALRQSAVRLELRGKARQVTRRYEFDGGQASPVLGPLGNLPLDLPVFTAERPRGGVKFKYTALSGADRPRGGLAGLEMPTEVEQQVEPVRTEKVKDLLGKETPRGADATVYRVQLETPRCKVLQLWQAGQPWPSYAENATTVARLVKVIPAE